MFEEKLKKCPFCGRSPVLVRLGIGCFIICQKCGCRTKKFQDEISAMEMWNRRYKKEQKHE